MGRKGNYAAALIDINILRQRAAYKSGESRPAPLVEWEPKSTLLAASEKAAPVLILQMGMPIQRSQ
jgi:hypothetical protein